MCHLVARRSAALAAAATGGLLRVMGRDGKHIAMQPTAIVVDGGLFEHYTAFRGCELRLVERHVLRLHSFSIGSAVPCAPIACRQSRATERASRGRSIHRSDSTKRDVVWAHRQGQRPRSPAAQVHRGLAAGAAGPDHREPGDAAPGARRVLARRRCAGGCRRARAGWLVGPRTAFWVAHARGWCHVQARPNRLGTPGWSEWAVLIRHSTHGQVRQVFLPLPNRGMPTWLRPIMRHTRPAGVGYAGDAAVHGNAPAGTLEVVCWRGPCRPGLGRRAAGWCAPARNVEGSDPASVLGVFWLCLSTTS